MSLRVITAIILLIGLIGILAYFSGVFTISRRGTLPTESIKIGQAAVCGTEIEIPCPTGFSCRRESGSQMAAGRCEPSAPFKHYTIALPFGTLTFFYPSDYNVSVSFTDPTNQEYIFTDQQKFDTVRVVIQPGMPRVPLPDEKIENIIVSGYGAKIYHDQDAVVGVQKVDRLIMTLPGGKTDLAIFGYGEVYQQIISSLNISK
ncbi:MAG: hypothetical protein HW383_60 [Candidatus Magasanikbacteria bacterium]|nr:hypothetical protein [Candidatus Magasanikbacteria bacterium]